MSETVTFTIEGAFITNHFRSLFLEGDWQSALTGFQQSLVRVGPDGKPINYPYENTVRVLMGKEKITGENRTLSVEDDDKEDEVKERLDYMYKHLIFSNDKLYEPYAYINTIQEGDDLAYDRALIYANDNKRDIVVYSTINGSKHPILCEEVSKTIPTWLFQHYKDISKEEKISESIKKGLIKTRGLEGDENFDDIIEYQKLDDLDEEVSVEREARVQLYDSLIVNKIREKVIEKAKNGQGFFEVKLKDNREFIVPKAPFFNWALGQNSSTSFNRMPWEPISGRNFKMYGDNPEHTDWVIGMGLHYNDYYKDKVLSEHMSSLAFKIYKLHNKEVEFITLAGEGFASGTIKYINDPSEEVNYNEIPVIPYASVEYVELAKSLNKKQCLITLVGGPGAHLVVNAKELNLKMILMPEQGFKEGDYVYFNLNKQISEVYGGDSDG